MSSLLIKNATVVNEGRIFAADVYIAQGRIEQVASQIDRDAAQTIDAEGLHLLPGFIDDQVHFREPGLTHKADIASESRAALAGGTTSFMEMPNVKPPTVTLAALEAKFARAAEVSWVNYSFYLGATNDNVEEIKRLDPNAACGVKIFMGSSTGNMLVDRDEALRQIFLNSPTLIATHCEDTPMIEAREAEYRQKYGDAVPFSAHPEIRCREACYKSSSQAVALAKETGANLHILHITTAEELALFSPGPVEGKQITSEACVHHLWFCDDDYEEKGSLIKCNPAIKSAADRQAIRQAVIDGRIDVIATDHAPHTLAEKSQSYFQAPAGLPQVQRSLQALLDLYHQGVFSLPLIVEKTSHAVAKRFQIKERGFIREGYWADLVLVDLNRPEMDTREAALYKCGWSPWEGHTFQSTIMGTLVNGQLKYWQGQFAPFTPGARLTFTR
ncbi:MAG TPA: dihydroorotase [Piscirickettsiaceae bacterium]|nr:dihydroorotase [Piscirickettsiaceae bacterium]